MLFFFEIFFCTGGDGSGPKINDLMVYKVTIIYFNDIHIKIVFSIMFKLGLFIISNRDHNGKSRNTFFTQFLIPKSKFFPNT